MSDVSACIEHLRSSWSKPRIAVHDGEPVAVPFSCTFSAPADARELAQLPTPLPADLQEFWRTSNGASLFTDETYGQWGLRLYDIQQCLDESRRFASMRASDAAVGDLVVGEFRGDSDLLLVRCDPDVADFGSVVVALPLDGRTDWDRVASSFSAFLVAYADAQGQKFWS